MLIDIVMWFNDTLLVLLLGIAVVVLLWNVMRYAIFHGDTSEGRENARRLMIWGVIALFILTAIWGILSIFISFFNLDNRPIVGDYQCKKEGNCDGGTWNNDAPILSPTDSRDSFQGDIEIPDWAPNSV